MLLAEIKHRKFNFILATLAVAAAVSVWLSAKSSLADFDQNTESQLTVLEEKTNVEMKKLEDDIRKTMKGLGFNVFLFPAGEELWQIKERGYSEKTIPQDSVNKLAESKIVTVNHLLPQLSRRIQWQEKTAPSFSLESKDKSPSPTAAKRSPSWILSLPAPSTSATTSTNPSDSKKATPSL